METESRAVTSDTTFRVKTDAFEGPFGLLLDLVEKRKLFINDVSLASVTEDFLNHMNKLSSSNALSYSEIASFVLVASTLVLIKSKSLIPNMSLTSEEEGDIKNLEERLQLYKIFIELGIHVKNNFGKQIIFAPLERKNDILVFMPDNQITKESVMVFAQGVLGAIPKKTFLPEVEVRKVISIEEVIDKLTTRIQSAMTLNFREFAGEARTRAEKVNVIVSFLAMLEMVRNGILNVMQNNHAEDIIIEKINDTEAKPLLAEF